MIDNEARLAHRDSWKQQESSAIKRITPPRRKPRLSLSHRCKNKWVN